MKQLKRFKKWFSKKKVIDLKEDKKDFFKNKSTDIKLENPDVIQGGAKKEDTTVDPQWPVTH